MRFCGNRPTIPVVVLAVGGGGGRGMEYHEAERNKTDHDVRIYGTAGEKGGGVVNC